MWCMFSWVFSCWLDTSYMDMPKYTWCMHKWMHEYMTCMYILSICVHVLCYACTLMGVHACAYVCMYVACIRTWIPQGALVSPVIKSQKTNQKPKNFQIRCINQMYTVQSAIGGQVLFTRVRRLPSTMHWAAHTPYLWLRNRGTRARNDAWKLQYGRGS
jgi:hypothetical protein